MPGYDMTPPMTLAGMSSFTASRASLQSVTIGDGSYSPGDVYVESLFPKVKPMTTNSSTSSSSSKPGSREAHQPPHYANAMSQDPQANNAVEVLSFAEHPSILRAQDECATLLNGNDVSILEDEDVKEVVAQISGADAELVFPCRNIFQYLVLFLKDMERFIEIHVDVLDDQQVYRHLKATNARSLAKVEPKHVQLPMVLDKKPGWRYVCLDLHDLTRRAFGSKHVTTTRVRITGQCRLLRVFFQDERYSDAELPAHLTFLG